MRRALVLGLIIGLILIVLVPLIATMMAWSPLNSLETDIDLNSGRLRHTRHIAYFKVYESFEDTLLSKAIERRDGVPEWHRLGVVSPPFVNYSPSFVFSPVWSQMRDLEDLWDLLQASPDFRRKSAEQLLGLWEAEGSTTAAGQFLLSLEHFWHEDRPPGPASELLESSLSPREHLRDGTITRTFFYPDHKPLLRVEGYLDSKGRFVRNGVSVIWHRSGRMESHRSYKAGVLNGPSYYWDQNGKLSSITVYRNGHLTDFAAENLERRQEYETAKRLASESLPAE
jgi:hypothetical protein